jgi:ATP-dependent RNA helicase DeaD
MEHDVTALEIGAALAKLVQGDEPLLMAPPKKVSERDRERDERPRRDDGNRGRDRNERNDRPRRESNERGGERERRPKREFSNTVEMETFRIEVGHAHGVKPGNIVGAIANETGIDGDHIARIRIEDDYSTVELPAGMPKELINELRKVRVVGQALNISKVGESSGSSAKYEPKSEGRKTLKFDDSKPKSDKSKKRLSSTSRRAKEPKDL